MKNEEIFELSLEPEWVEDANRAYDTILGMGETVRTITEADSIELLQGGVDIHCHTSRDPEVDGAWDMIETTKKATDIGMGAVVFKEHATMTASSVYYVQQVVDEYAKSIEKKPAKACGGVVLNNYVGGLNPSVVEVCARVGGKIVWLPSHDNAHHRRIMGKPGGIELLDENDKPVPELYEIFKIVAENDMILDPCHASTKDRFVVIREAMKAGVKKIVITHPNWNVTKATHEQMAEMGKMGAFIGIFMYGDVPNFNNTNCDPMGMVEIIKKVGPERIVLGSDLGTVINMPPWEGMKLWMRLFLALGMKKKDIRTMVRDNSSWLLGL